jgi:WD40 repeat protein
MKLSLPLNPASLLAVTVLCSALTTACGQTTSNAVTPVNAAGIKPDKVATSLMPVPIYNFAVHNVAFSPDGKLVATGDGNGVVRLWETATGKLQHKISAHTNWVFAVAWAHDGRSFVTGGWDDLLHLFYLPAPAKPARTYSGHEGDVHAVVTAGLDPAQLANWQYPPPPPALGRIFSAGDDKQIIVWGGGRQGLAGVVKKWPAHDKAIPALALSPDENILASGSRDRSIKLWDPVTGKLQDTLIGHTEDVMSVCFSSDGKLLASASYDTTVRLWDVASGKAIRIFEGHTNRAFSVCFSPDSKQFASAGDATVRLWDVASGAVLKVFAFGGVIATGEQNVNENISSVAFSRDGKVLAVGSTTGRAFLVSPETGAVIHQISESLPKQ